MTTRTCLAQVRQLAPILLGAVIAGGAAAAPAAAPAPAHQLAPGNWVVMGSSTAAGTGAPRGKGWAALLAAAYASHGVKVVNLARNGAVSYQGLGGDALRTRGRPAPHRKSNIDAALAHEPVLLILSYPSNDTASGYGTDETVANLLAIRERAAAAGAAVLVLSTQPRRLDEARLAQLRVIDDSLADAVGACFVPVREALEGEDGRLAPRYDAGDGVHLTSAGHALVAQRITDTIASGRCVRMASGRDG